MADSFTAVLALTKPEVNASANVWGNKWNANADKLETAYVAAQAQIAALIAAQAYSIPIGGIIIFNGGVAPAGWHLCDGTGGTPDLRDKFIVGAGATYGAGVIGGSATVALTGAETGPHTHTMFDPGHTHGVSDPAHAHTGATDAQGGHVHTVPTHIGPYNGVNSDLGSGAGGSFHGSDSTGSAGIHNHNVTVGGSATGITLTPGLTNVTTYSAGAGAAHNNMPPYYALAYIMRVV